MVIFTVFGIWLSSYVATSEIGNKYDAPIIGGFIVLLLVIILLRFI